MGRRYGGSLPRIGIVMLAVLVVPTAALARVAQFKVSLQGTYTAHATMTDSHCYVVDDNDNVTYFTQTGSATENDTFHSLRPINLSVGQFPRQRVFNAGSFSPLRTVFIVRRESATNPRYCTPSDANNPVAPDCGSKQGAYGIRIYGRVDRPAFSFVFSRPY